MSYTRFFNNDNIFKFINSKIKEIGVLNKDEKQKLTNTLVNYFLIDESKAFTLIEYYLKYKKIEKEDQGKSVGNQGTTYVVCTL